MKSIARTDIGLVRFSNQDMVFASDSAVGILPNLYVVADGMGGERAGDYASCYAVREFVRLLRQSDRDWEDPAELMAQAAMEVNAGLYEESGKDGPHKGTGTTLVAAVIKGTTLYAINIGDSRLYLLENGIRQITQDHSFAEELVRLGQVERGTEEYQNNKHIITRAVGPWESLSVDTFRITLTPGDSILLCSDGLCGMIPDEQTERIVRRFQPFTPERLADCAEALIAEAKQNGGTDNITLILVAPGLS